VCLVGEDGVDHGDAPTTYPADKSMLVMTKDRAKTIARFSTALDKFLVGPISKGAAGLSGRHLWVGGP
jgi:hypothetical protein